MSFNVAHIKKIQLCCGPSNSDVNKDWTCKDKDQAYKDQDKDKDKDFIYSYLLQVAAKPTIAIKQQQ